MTCSRTLLSLVLLLACSSWGIARAHGGGVKHIRLYMHETSSGPNATTFATVPARQAGGSGEFGMIELLDNELLDGPYPSKSTLLGRFQGLVAFAGLSTPPGMQSVISFIFTAGRFRGSTLVITGTVVSFEGAFERPIVGGTGVFRMARGWCVVKAVSNPTPESTVYEANLFVKTEGNLQMALNMDA